MLLVRISNGCREIGSVTESKMDHVRGFKTDKFANSDKSNRHKSLYFSL